MVKLYNFCGAGRVAVCTSIHTHMEKCLSGLKQTVQRAEKEMDELVYTLTTSVEGLRFEATRIFSS